LYPNGTLLVGVGQTKIHKLDAFVEVNQQVLRLEVAMHNVQPVQVFNSG
jgi:hypothetical protein